MYIKKQTNIFAIGSEILFQKWDRVTLEGKLYVEICFYHDSPSRVRYEMINQALSHVIWRYHKHIQRKQQKIRWRQGRAQKPLRHPARLQGFLLEPMDATFNSANIVNFMPICYQWKFDVSGWLFGIIDHIMKRTNHLGRRKNEWKKVLMPSVSSCNMRANPKRKNARCLFLSCGQRAFHAETKHMSIWQTFEQRNTRLR